MKLLKIQVSGLKLFEKDIEIDFYAKQRVSADNNEMVTNIFSNVYINNVISFVGINASGKTTILKVISFVLQLLKNEPINTIETKTILEGLEVQDEVVFTTYFITNNEKLAKLNTVIKLKYDGAKIDNELKKQYFIAEEKLWIKPFSSVRTKKELFDFSATSLETTRNNAEPYLLEDVSIIVSLNKLLGESLFVIDSIGWTNFNSLRMIGDFPIDLVQFLDPSVEYLKCSESKLNNQKLEIRLKFYHREEMLLHSLLELDNYLSSGTLKGLNVFMSAFFALESGGYILIDELENHFNKEIVSTLIKFFMDRETNQSGAVLIFSTHYVELMDLFERNDNLFITKNKGGITVENLADLLTRNDVKKSDLFQSGYLDNTAPSYTSYINLKRMLVKKVQE